MSVLKRFNGEEWESLGGGHSGKSAPNLLDNPWFTVNQRGATTYSVGQYGVDRWKLISGTATVSGSQITLNGTLRQIRENALGRNDFVCSVKCAIGSATVSYDDSTKYFDIVSSGGVIDAVKLEIGSVSTLGMDVEPNYAEELEKCRRYYYETDYMMFPITIYSNGTKFTISFEQVERMRTRPAVSFKAFSWVRGSGSNFTNVSSGYVIVPYSGVPTFSVDYSSAVFDGFNLQSASAYLQLILSADL